MSGFASDDALVIHEWGTFTSLQDEQGRMIGGLNVDDEPLPAFVHDVSGSRLIDDARPKGIPNIGPHPQVTIRLETPVVYFYPPAGWGKTTLDVEVAFHGGWLTQFYPNATFAAPGIDVSKAKFGLLTGDTVGTLAWKGITIGGDAPLPLTKSSVWMAPRAVHAAIINAAADGEHEKYLFYRGVGNIDAPLTVVRPSSGGNRVMLRNGPDGQAGFPLIRSPRADSESADRGDDERGDYYAWLVDVHPNGDVAFRGVRARSMNLEIAHGRPGAPIADVVAEIKESDFSAVSLQRLRDQMRAALVHGGLFPDEAEAMLNTWNASYFKSPGERLFFLVPREWTDRCLPLKVSAPAKITRVMVGRIELVTPEQRKLVERLDGGGSPEVAASYGALGRFRQAIVLDQQQQNPTDRLHAFITARGIKAYQLP